MCEILLLVFEMKGQAMHISLWDTVVCTLHIILIACHSPDIFTQMILCSPQILISQSYTISHSAISGAKTSCLENEFPAKKGSFCCDKCHPGKAKFNALVYRCEMCQWNCSLCLVYVLSLKCVVCVFFFFFKEH